MSKNNREATHVTLRYEADSTVANWLEHQDSASKSMLFLIKQACMTYGSGDLVTAILEKQLATEEQGLATTKVESNPEPKKVVEPQVDSEPEPVQPAPKKTDSKKDASEQNVNPDDWRDMMGQS